MINTSMKSKEENSWRSRLNKLLGSQEKRTRRISHTLSELRTQLTPQFAKSTNRAAGSASRQVSAARVPGGFTITELLVATAVFAGVLLLVVVGFTQIGRLFYKGVTVSQTRQAATQIMDSVTTDIRLSTASTPTTYICTPTVCTGLSTSTTNGYCIGNHVYIYQNSLVNLSTQDLSTNFGIMRGQLTGGSCPGSFTTADISGTKPVEMLGDNMRLADFSITPSLASPGSYVVKLVVAYGQDSVFTSASLGSTDPICKGIATGSQFCSKISLTESASNRPSLAP